MKIEAAMLCDSAQVANGKLFILGGAWNIYGAANYPINIQIGLAVDVSFTKNEVGIKYPLTITIADEAGIPIIPAMNGQIEIGVPSQQVPNDSPLKLPLALNTGIMLPRPGRYSISISAGSSKAQLTFNAVFVGNKVDLTVAYPETGEQGN